MKKISVFLSENFQFLGVKFSMHLNRRVFVMWNCDSVSGLRSLIGHSMASSTFKPPFPVSITKIRLFKYIEYFTSKNLNFSDKKN